MVVASSDIKFYLTGASSNGGAQAVAAASLGNYRSSTECVSTANGFFDSVSGAEATAGDTEYRCFCIKNGHATDSLYSAVIWISTDTGNAEDNISYAVEVPTTSDTAGTAQTIGTEAAAPTVNSGNVSNWSDAVSKATGVAININAHDANLDAGEIVFVWLKRVIAVSASSVANESVTIAIGGDTA